MRKYISITRSECFQILQGPKAHMTQEGVDLMLCTLIENPTRPRGVLDCVSFQAIEDYRE